MIAGIAGLGGLYALISVVNAVALACASRKREFAVGRLSGLTRSQVVRATVLESLGVAVIGVSLGAVAVAACLWAAQRGFRLLVGSSVLVVPWLATRPAPISLAAARE